jgi:hypothetical protein
MSNENKTKPVMSLTETNITPTETGIMYFLAFEGLFCLMWLAAMYFDYTFSMIKPLARISLLSQLFFAYIVFKNFRENAYSFRCFVGLSLPILIVLIMIYSRQWAENWFFGKRPIIGSFTLLMFPIMVTAFSIPINVHSIRRAYHIVFVILFTVGIIVAYSWYDWLFKGLSMRDQIFWIEEAPIIKTFWSHTDGSVIFSVGMYGALLGLVAFSGWCTQKLHWTFFLAGYSLGSIMICFSAYKTIYLAWIFVNIWIFITEKIFKKERKVLLFLILLLLTINIVSLSLVGKNDQYGILKRFIDYSKSINKDVNDYQRLQDTISDLHPDKQKAHGKIVQDSKTENKETTTIHDLKEKTTITIHDLYEHHPFLLQDKTRANISSDYRAMSKCYSDVNPRIILNLAAWDAILNNPICGYGFCLITNVNGEYVKLSPHCNITTIFLATGFIGGILFFVIIIRGFFDSVIVCRHYPDYSWLAVIFLFSFVSNIFDTRVFSFNELWIPLVVLRACVRSAPNNNEKLILTDNA